MIPLLKPKEIIVHGLEFTIGKFPATAGRDIFRMNQNIVINSDKYNKSNEEEMILRVMGFVGKKIDGRDQLLILSSKELIDNHIVSDYPSETLDEIIKEVLEYNFSFFQDGRN